MQLDRERQEKRKLMEHLKSLESLEKPWKQQFGKQLFVSLLNFYRFKEAI